MLYAPFTNDCRAFRCASHSTGEARRLEAETTEVPVTADRVDLAGHAWPRLPLPVPLPLRGSSPCWRVQPCVVHVVLGTTQTTIVVSTANAEQHTPSRKSEILANSTLPRRGETLLVAGGTDVSLSRRLASTQASAAVAA